MGSILAEDHKRQWRLTWFLVWSLVTVLAGSVVTRGIAPLPFVQSPMQARTLPDGPSPRASGSLPVTIIASGALSGIPITVDRQSSLTLVHLGAAAPLPDGNVLEAWMVGASNQPVRIKSFRADSPGGTTITLPPLADSDSVVVTSEPGPDGRPQPTGKRDLVIQGHW
jgi:hypothetical protein